MTRGKGLSRSKGINAVSDKRKRKKRVYMRKREPFLEARPHCEIRSPVCTGRSTEISHIVGNGRSGGAGYLDEANWKAACHPCGQYVEHHKQWALEEGHHRHGWEAA